MEVGKPSPQLGHRSVLKEARATALVTGAVALASFLGERLIPFEYLAMLPEPLREAVTNPHSPEIAIPFGLFLFSALVYRKRVVLHPKGKPRPDRFNIWVAELQGDTRQNRERTLLLESMREILGDSVAILRADIRPQLIETPEAGSETDIGNAMALQYMEENSGDLFIWGQCFPVDEERVVDLRFVSPTQYGTTVETIPYNPKTRRPDAMRLGPVLESTLSALLWEERCRLAPLDRTEIADILPGIVAKLIPLSKAKFGGFPIRLRAVALLRLGSALRVLSATESSISRCRQAIRILHAARHAWHRIGDDPLQEARSLFQLGSCYRWLGERFSQKRHLLTALKALRAAEEELRTHGEIEDWLRCKGLEADSLYRLVDYSEGTAPLEEALEICRLALSEPAAPGSTAYLNLLLAQANAYSLIAQRERSDEKFRLADETFKEIVRGSNKRPTDKAMAQMNSAINSLEWWDLNHEGEHLRHVLESCENAIGVFSPDFEPGYYGKCQQLMGDAFYYLREWVQAIERYQQALRYLTSESDPDERQRTIEMMSCAQENVYGRLVVTAPQAQSGSS